MNTETHNEIQTQTEPSVSSVCSSSVLSVSPPPPPPERPLRSTRGLSRLELCSERQLQHINAWLDEAIPYRTIVDNCKIEFQIAIPLTTIQRYNKRTDERDLILDLAESKEAAAELAKYSQTGDARFSTNTLEILEQKAFDLTVAYHRDRDADDLAKIERLTKIINKGKNTAIRERHAAVQEKKNDLRAQEIDLKRQLTAARVAILQAQLTNLMKPRSADVCAKRTSSTEVLASSLPGVVQPTAQSSAENIAVTGSQTSFGGGTSPARSASQSTVLAFGSPTLTSRDAIDETRATPADTFAPERTQSPSEQNHHSSPAPHHFQGLSSLPPEVLEYNRRHAELLLAGKIKTDYVRDPENSLFAKICAMKINPQPNQQQHGNH